MSNQRAAVVAPKSTAVHGTTPPLFVVPGYNGIAELPPALIAHIRRVRPVYSSLRYPGLRPGETPLETVEELAAFVAREIKAIYPEGPYGLCGYSFGGLVAFEAACQLVAQGFAVDALVMWESYFIQPAHFINLSLVGAMRELQKRLKWRSPRARWRFLWILAQNQWKIALTKISKKQRRLSAKVFGKGNDRLKASLVESAEDVVARASGRAEWAYKPKTFTGDAVFFCASEIGGVFRMPAQPKEGGGWRSVMTGRFEVVEIQGHHLDLFEEPGIQILGEKTVAWLKNNVATELP